jgi:hypothetical protein
MWHQGSVGDGHSNKDDVKHQVYMCPPVLQVHREHILSTGGPHLLLHVRTMHAGVHMANSYLGYVQTLV